MAAALALAAVAITLAAWASADPARLLDALDWQPGRGGSEPWRAFTAAGVHRSLAHLGGNLLATALVAWLGLRARVVPRDAMAWALSWPMTQAGLGAVAAVAPQAYAANLPHYGGLSGVLHAGVVIVALSLLAWTPDRGEDDDAPDARRARWVGLALLVGTVAKVLSESPWDLSPRPDAMLGIAVAPIAHASGVAAGLLAFAALRAGQARSLSSCRPWRP